jgi:hypothetical protein
MFANALLLAVMLGASAMPPPAALEEVVAEPQRFLGQSIRVEGRVAAVIDPRFLTVEPLRGGGRLAVAIPHRVANGPLRIGRLVSVTGRLWLATEDVLTGWPVLGPLRAVILEMSGHPLVVADSVLPSGGPELVVPPPVVRTVERVVAAADKPSLVGRRIALTRVSVHDMAGPRSLIVRDDVGHTLFVQMADPNGTYAPWFGERVDVEGVIRMAATAVYPWSLLPAPDAISTTQQLYVLATRVRPSPPTGPHDEGD